MVSAGIPVDAASTMEESRKVPHLLTCILIGFLAVFAARDLRGSPSSTVGSVSGGLDLQSPGGRQLTEPIHRQPHSARPTETDHWGSLFAFMLAAFIGLGVITRVSRLLHTPLMSLTNAISAIAVVGSIIVAGGDHPGGIRLLGAIALFASMTNIVSGFLITDRMLKMFKEARKESKP
jgi:NAD(P) transhydrogenase subunit alpha